MDTYRSLPRDAGTWSNQREFHREKTRSSLSANHPMVDRWLDRQEQVGQRTHSDNDSAQPIRLLDAMGQSCVNAPVSPHVCVTTSPVNCVKPVSHYEI